MQKGHWHEELCFPHLWIWMISVSIWNDKPSYDTDPWLCFIRQWQIQGRKRAFYTLFRPISAMKLWINAILRWFCRQICCIIQIMNQYQWKTVTRLCWRILIPFPVIIGPKMGDKRDKNGGKNWLKPSNLPINHIKIIIFGPQVKRVMGKVWWWHISTCHQNLPCFGDLPGGTRG